MDLISKEIKRKIIAHGDVIFFVSGIVTLLMGYLEWGVWTLMCHDSRYFVWELFLLPVIVLCYVTMSVLSIKATLNERFSWQLMRVSQTGSVCLGIIFMATVKHLFLCRDYFIVLIECCWLGTFWGTYIYLHNGVSGSTKRQTLGKWIKTHGKLGIILLVTLVFMIDPDIMQFKWDGLLYYKTCSGLNVMSMSSLAVYGHIAQTYGILNGLCNLILNNTGVSMMIVNCVCMLVSICAFYGVLKQLVPRKKERLYLFGTAVYAWSPYLLGMVHYYNLDFLCQCLFPLVLYCLYKKEWIYFGLVSLLFCFTKEPAVVVYAALCLGVLAKDWILDKNLSLKKRIHNIFKRKQYYVMCMCGFLWLMTYLLLGPWSAGVGGFELDLQYIVEKLKVLYLFQFNWIFSLIILAGCVYFFCKHKGEQAIVILPLFFAQIGFTLFSCMFKTVNHPRYIDTNQVTLYLMAVFIILSVGNTVGKLWIGIMPFIMLVSSFATVDPLTKAAFQAYDMGDGMIVTTVGDVPLGDGMIYNRQMLGLEGVINLAIKDSLADGHQIVFPALDDNPYYFDGMVKVGPMDDKYQITQEYWNESLKKRVDSLNGDSREELQKFSVIQFSDSADFQTTKNVLNGKMDYYYLPGIMGDLASDIDKEYTFYNEKVYIYRGWVLKKITLDLQEYNE